MPDPRFVVFGPAWTKPAAAIQICRNYDGRILAMSVAEARGLAAELHRIADQVDERQGARTA